MSFPAYPNYKESGIEWLGQVPDHWQILRNKALFQEEDDRASGNDHELMTVSHITGVTPRSEKNVSMILSESLDGYKKAQSGDLVINTMWAWMGALGISPCEGVFSPSYNVYRLRDRDVLWPEYYDLLCRIPSHVAAMKANSTGIWESRLRLYPGVFLGMSLCLPPKDEQRKIVEFLRVELAKIDSLIEEQLKLTDTLTERLSALALTAHSAASSSQHRLSEIVDVISRPINRQVSDTYVALGLFNRGRGLFHKDAQLGSDMGDSNFFWVHPNDLIFSGQFAWEGAVAMAGVGEEGCVVSHRYPIVRGIESIVLTEYIYALFLTSHGTFLLNENSRGAAGRNRPLNLRTLLREKISVPEISIQKEIAMAVAQRSEQAKTMEKQMLLLKERRSALIALAVTGKIDVRTFLSSRH